MKPVSDLYGTCTGRDIYVLGSGPTLGYIDPGFFVQKITIGVNDVWRAYPCDYVVCKEHHAAIDAAQAGKTVVVARYHCGDTTGNRLDGFGGYVFEHEHNRLQQIDWSVLDRSDHLVVSYSTITSAIHLAARMGASNIILVGHDCGTLDGMQNYDGYPPSPLGATFYDGFLNDIELQTVALRERLQQKYGCQIVSLNPFVNVGLEGHIYKRSGARS